MRVGPVGLAFRNRDDLYARAAASAAATHAHPVSVDGAAVMAVAVAAAASGSAPATVLERARAASHAEMMAARLEDIGRLWRDGAGMDLACTHFGASIMAHETIPQALLAFLHHPRDYRACLRYAVRHPKDADTVAAMAGTLAGAHAGPATVPPRWRARTEGLERIRAAAAALAARFA